MTHIIMARHGLVRWTALILILVLMLAIPAAAIGHRLYTIRLAYLVDRGTAALEREDVAEAQRMVRTLERRGYDSAARLLRGRILLQQARAVADKAPRPFPYEGMQQAAQLVLAAAELSEAPAALRGATWKAASLVQQPFPRQISGAEDFHNAMQEFVQVLDDDPWAAEATILTSECLVRLEERRPAVMALTTLLDRQPDNVDAHRWLAAIYIDLNSPGPAVKHLQKWARLDPTNPRPYRWLGFFTRDGLFTGDAADPVDSVEAYRKALQLGLEPRDHDAVLRELAELLMNTHGDFAAALETLDLGSQAFQDQPSIRAQRAHCLVHLDKREQAIGILDEVLHGYPSTKAALLLRAQIYFQEDQPQAAIPLLEKLISLDPNDFVGRQNLMLAYGAIKDDHRATEQRQHVEKLEADRQRLFKIRQQTADPWNANARLQLALAYTTVSRSESLAWIHAAFASNPTDQTIRKTWTQMIGYQPPTLLRPSPSAENQ